MILLYQLFLCTETRGSEKDKISIPFQTKSMQRHHEESRPTSHPQAKPE